MQIVNAPGSSLWLAPPTAGRTQRALWLSRLRILRRRAARNWPSLRSHRFDPIEEQAFQVFYAERIYAQARFGIALAFFAWCTFAIWDVLAFPELCRSLIAVRLLVVAPVLAGLWRFIARQPARFKTHLSFYLSIAPLAASAGLLIMMGLTYRSDPLRSFELLWPAFAGLYFFQYAFLGLLFRPAAILGNVSLLSLCIFGIVGEAAPHVLARAFLELAILNFLGMIICARNDIHQRALFRLRQYYQRQVTAARSQREHARQARDDALAERLRAESASVLVQRERIKVEELTREKERFFSAAYHDLQQPLSIIGLYARLASTKLGNGQSASIRADLTVIEGASQDIAAMFKGVRDIWEVGRVEPDVGVVDLSELLAEISNELRGRAERSGLSLRLRNPTRMRCLVNSDRALIKRAISNLVCNAIKYTEHGGVVVGAVVSGAHARIIVRDTGEGIPADFHERIFQEYFRVDNPARARRCGLGLGLSIVNRIAKALPNHQLGFWSKPGRGSRFSLTVPIAECVSREGRRTRVQNLTASAQALAGKYVFVVEDERLILDGLVESLRSAGCVVEGVGCVDTARALLAVRDRCPDVLVTDYRLRYGKTGLDIVSVMRDRFEWAASTPVVFVTGELNWQVPPEGFQGVWEVLRKPIDPDVLVSRLGELVSLPRR